MAWELIDTLAADGDSDAWDHPGGEVCVWVGDDLGGGTATLVAAANYDVENGDSAADFDDISSDGGAEGQRTAAGFIAARMPPCRMRVNLAGATAPDMQVRKAASPEQIVRA